MSSVLFFRRLKENVGAGAVNIACIFMIALLLCACAGGNKKQTLSQANETGQVSAEAESVNGETSDDQEIVCRRIAYTGSRFKHKVCNTKAQWARLDRKHTEDTDEFQKEIDRNTSIGAGSSSDSMGGASSGMPR